MSAENDNQEINQLKIKVESMEKDVNEKTIEIQKLQTENDVLRKDLTEK